MRVHTRLVERAVQMWISNSIRLHFAYISITVRKQQEGKPGNKMAPVAVRMIYKKRVYKEEK
jgi:hypothetical protein